MTKPKHFVFLLVEEFSHIAFSNAVEPLRIANLLSGTKLYQWSFASLNGETATSSNESVTLVHHSFSQLPKCDQIFVLSGINMKHHVSTQLLSALRLARTKGIKIGALCSGSYVLAKAGFMDGLQTAIHWDYHDSFMEEFPDVKLVRNVFVADEKFITASGGTATADLMLHLIEKDCDSDLSIAVADQMVYNTVRDASAEQQVSLQSRKGMRNAHLVKAIARMKEMIETPISPSVIASEIGISTRQLERIFGKYLNTSPKKYYHEIRLERARRLLLQTEKPIIEVALACGFENSGHFSRVYRAAFGVSPSMQRNKIS